MNRHDLKSRRTLSNLNLVTSFCTPNMFMLCKTDEIRFNLYSTPSPFLSGQNLKLIISAHFCYNCKYQIHLDLRKIDPVVRGEYRIVPKISRRPIAIHHLIYLDCGPCYTVKLYFHFRLNCYLF